MRPPRFPCCDPSDFRMLTYLATVSWSLSRSTYGSRSGHNFWMTYIYSRLLPLSVDFYVVGGQQTGVIYIHKKLISVWKVCYWVIWGATNGSNIVHSSSLKYNRIQAKMRPKKCLKGITLGRDYKRGARFLLGALKKKIFSSLSLRGNIRE